ncbi:hypothetical protein ACJX0J_026112, partial [Zea mays]
FNFFVTLVAKYAYIFIESTKTGPHTLIRDNLNFIHNSLNSRSTLLFMLIRIWIIMLLCELKFNAVDTLGVMIFIRCLHIARWQLAENCNRQTFKNRSINLGGFYILLTDAGKCNQIKEVAVYTSILIYLLAGTATSWFPTFK